MLEIGRVLLVFGHCIEKWTGGDTSYSRDIYIYNANVARERESSSYVYALECDIDDNLMMMM